MKKISAEYKDIFNNMNIKNWFKQLALEEPIIFSILIGNNSLLKTILSIYKETGNQFYDNFANVSTFLNTENNIINFSFDLDLLNKNKYTEKKLGDLIEILLK